ncbi:hypothetical protein KPL43_04285 [Clostridium estertheticum]|nr:hypothetical protein [Clostridium estertheticum]MBU3162703.1 hypothetical protein [Clostridium estertheticum]MBU3184915.1 hypothetical protein [Clostridium estertheticum]
MIDILERKNFIKRHPNKEDRRSIDIHITADGLGTCKKVTPFLEDINGTVYIENKHIKVPKLKSMIKIKQHREFNGLIKSCTIS